VMQKLRQLWCKSSLCKKLSSPPSQQSYQDPNLNKQAIYGGASL
jgi:hypothetical protein